MKFKTLRTIAEPREFVHIDVHQNLNFCSVSTSNIPKIQPETATLDEMKVYFAEKKLDIDWENIELIELELIEPNTTGADIRNKLSPIKNLLSILRSSKVPLHENPKINEIIQEEIIRAESSVAYIANLL
jgi:hypothetical protein